MGKNIGIYFSFGVGSAALVVVQTLILWIFCSIEVRQEPSPGICIATTNATHRPVVSCMSGWLLPSSALQ